MTSERRRLRDSGIRAKNVLRSRSRVVTESAMMLARQYFARAALCEKMAHETTDLLKRAELLKAAQAWRTLGEERLAEVSEAQSQTSSGKRPGEPDGDRRE